MTAYRYQALGPLLAGEGSRAFLGLAITADQRARPVVIVWVPEAAEKDPALLERIRRETEHAAILDHPNIVTVLGFAALDEGHARVVEFADGESLRKVLAAAGTLPVHLAARVICDACTGVHYAHVAGNDDGSPLVHGDLRPQTLLVCFHGATKVTGYGALAFAPDRPGGPRVYSAPEQVVAGRRLMTVATDVYLLGLSLYESLTGQVPFDQVGDVFDQAVLEAPFPEAPLGTIPPALEAVIRKACARRPEDRHATPLQLREAIEAALEGHLGSAEEVARTLERLFPQSHQLRADRRHTIDTGIADFVRRQWAEQERTGPARPPAEAPLPPSPPPAPPPAVPAPVAPPARPASRPLPPTRVVVGGRPVEPVRLVEAPTEPIEPEEDAPAEEGSTLPWLLGLALFVAVVASFWAWNKANAPIPGVDRTPAPAARPSRPAAPVDDAGPPSPPVGAGGAAALAPALDAGASPDSGALSGDAGAAPAPDGGSGLPPAGPGAGAALGLDGGALAEVPVTVEVEPPVELLVDGKLVGRTPWSGTLPAGRRVLTLQSKPLGISTTRVLLLRTERVVEQVVLEKGSVAVAAPEGAVILIDGLRVGVAPLAGEVPIYEGQHRILVLVGASKWTDAFTLLPRQRVSFNVEVE